MIFHLLDEPRPDVRGAPIMRTRTALCLLTLLLGQPVVGDDQKPDSDQLSRDLIGTWESVLPPEAPKSIRHIKHVTPTHYTRVTYDADNDRILATSGGSCSVKGDQYEEVCEFATDSHQHVRGKTFNYLLKLAGDKWNLLVQPTVTSHRRSLESDEAARRPKSRMPSESAANFWGHGNPSSHQTPPKR